MEETRKEVTGKTFHLRVRNHASAISGRNLYTKEEDQAIKQYVDQFLQVSSDTCSLAGNKLWQEMEEKKVTNRTWRSMRDRYLKYIRQKPGCTVKPSEDEPDSSGSSFGPSRKRQLKVQNVTDDDNCPSSSTLMYKSRKNFARCNSPSYGNISSTSSEILKRPEPAFTSSKEKKITNSGHTVETLDSDIGGKYSSEDDNEDKLSEFDEKILNLAESDSESDTEYSTDEIETRPSNSGMKAVADCLTPDQIAVLECVHVLRCRRKATLAEIFYTLFCTSGSLEGAMTYLEGGEAENVWTFEDDKILLSTGEQAITELIESRGIQAVENRISFLETSSDSGGDT